MPVSLQSPSSNASTQSVNVDMGVTLPSASILSKKAFGPSAVRTIDGANALMVMPSSIIFGARERTSPSTACLDVP